MLSNTELSSSSQKYLEASYFPVIRLLLLVLQVNWTFLMELIIWEKKYRMNPSFKLPDFKENMREKDSHREREREMAPYQMCHKGDNFPCAYPLKHPSEIK